jgi:hypothetical protein
MPYSVSTDPKFETNETLEAMRQEVRDYQRCVKQNSARFGALTDVQAVCGSAFDSESCAPISRDVLRAVLAHAVTRIIDGEMRVTGGTNNWSVGFMGSRWIDLNASEFGLDYVRCAFFSKKFFKGEWKGDKPFKIQIICEKAN